MAGKSKSYTVMIVPNPPSRIHRFSIRHQSLRWILGAGSLLGVLLAFVLVHYFFLVDQVADQKVLIHVLQDNQRMQEARVHSFTETTMQLQEKMARLNEFDAKLRLFADIRPSQEGAQSLAMGGMGEASSGDPVSLGDLSGESLSRRIEEDITILQDQAVLQEVSFQDLEGAVKSKKIQWTSTPSIWPVRGWLAAGFGKRIHPITNQKAMHYGIDIATWSGTPVVAPADGLVTYVGTNGSFGKMIRIDHSYGIQTRYGHLSKYQTQKARRVKRGDVIGYVGQTGVTTGPHLHYEVLVNRIPVNPLRYILN